MFVARQVTVALLLVAIVAQAREKTEAVSDKNSLIYYQVSGAGLSSWQLARFLKVGPDGDLNWDLLPSISLLRSHAQDRLLSSGGSSATVHSHGIAVPSDACGLPQETSTGLMRTALSQGLATGILTTGMLANPSGISSFVAHAPTRGDYEKVASQLLDAGIDVLLGGGEEWFLPLGVYGQHGEGLRTDGRNLVEEAEKAGYRIVYTKEQLAELPNDTPKVLGLFASKTTFNPLPEEELAERRELAFGPKMPTIADLVTAALRFLQGQHFLLLAEEASPGRFGRFNNAQGLAEAMLRADEGLGVAADYVRNHPRTLLLCLAENEVGQPGIIPLSGDTHETKMLLTGFDNNGSPVDGVERNDKGGVAKPFISAVDNAGRAHPFVVCWGTRMATSGALVLRAVGANAERLRASTTSSDIHRLLQTTLFGAKRTSSAN